MPKAPIAIPAFRDNYIWALVEGAHCVVVDPGDAEPVRRFLRDHQLQLTAILVTHHHPDHVGGIDTLVAEHQVPVYGPDNETIPHCTHHLADGDRIQPEGLLLKLAVIAVPGHTLGHIAYYADQSQWLFAGDTLFAGGCGRLFEGTPTQMHHSLQRLAALPQQTKVYCAHEYTEANLRFAAMVSPDDPAVIARLEQVRTLRAAGEITLPSTIAEEKASNPFLRSHLDHLKQACQQHFGHYPATAEACFAALRQWKDQS